MESPGYWNLLTASLAVCDLTTELDFTWSFLTMFELVRDEPGDKETFIKIVNYEIDRGPITGPSVPRRVEMELRDFKIALPAGEIPDPWGKIAGENFKSIIR